MAKSLSPTRGERLLRVFKRLVVSMNRAGLARQVIEDRSFSGESMTLDGQKMFNFGLCSYLALGDDPRVKEGGKRAIDAYGASYSSSIAYSALPLYTDLRERMSEIFDANVIITGTTTLGHLTALPVLVQPGDRVLVDSQAHNSVMTATQNLQAGGIPIEQTPHNDMAALEETLASDDGSRHIWYLTDGLFSMHGDTSPAEKVSDLLERFPRLHVYCDDAHGFGWAGEHGRGQFLERSGWHERLVVIVGLAKAFGSVGGVIATPNAELAEIIEFCGPALTFGGPVAPPSLGASIAAADILLSNELAERQAALMNRIELVNQLSDQMGLPLVNKEPTPLWFHDIGDVSDMITLATEMRNAGFFVNGSGFPAVPHGHAGIRFTVTLDNSPQQIEDMLTCLNERRLEMFGETELEVDLAPLEEAFETSTAEDGAPTS